VGVRELRIVHEYIQAFLYIRLNDPQRICVSLVSCPFESGSEAELTFWSIMQGKRDEANKMGDTI